jgi:hypothetical protein
MRLFRTRLHALFSLVLLACGVTAVFVILVLPRERVTRANFEKIQVGMSLDEVERLLGPPYSELITVRATNEFAWEEGDLDCVYSTKWYGAELTIRVLSAGPLLTTCENRRARVLMVRIEPPMK